MSLPIATELENLKLRKDNLETAISAITTALATAAANYSVAGPSGQESYDYTSYTRQLDSLTKAYDVTIDQILRLEPYWLTSRCI